MLQAIEDFTTRTEKVGEQMSSSIFLAKKPNGKTSSWNLELYPKGESTKANNHLSIFLKNCDNFPMKAKYKVSILDSSSKKNNTSDSQVQLFDSTKNPIWGYDKWVVRQSIINNTGLLPGGHFTISCERTVYGTAKILSGSQIVENKSTQQP